MKSNPWTQPDPSHARFMSAGLLSILMVANVLAVLFLCFDISGAVFHTMKGTEGLSIIVFTVALGLNYVGIGRLGTYENMRSQFDQLSEQRRKRHVIGIKIYVALTAIIFILSLSLPHRIR
jgi:hypothetical protein